MGSCTDESAALAALNGHTQVVCYLYDNEINRFYGITLRNAAEVGQLEMIQTVVAQSGEYVGGYSTPESRLESCVNKMFQKLHDDEGNRDRSGRDQVLRRVRKSIQWFNRRGSPRFAARLLKVSLKYEHSRLVRTLFEPNWYGMRLRYAAAIHRDQHSGSPILLRWLIANRPQLDVATAVEFIEDGKAVKYVEVVSWLSEQGRVEVLSTAVREEWTDWEKLVLWTLSRTAFEDSVCLLAIRDVIERAPLEMRQWVKANLMSENAKCWWISNEATTDCCSPKRRRLA